MGYTSGVAEKLYNGFVEGTYLVEDKFENVSREEALKLFSDYYGEPYDTEEYLANTEDYVSISLLFSNQLLPFSISPSSTSILCFKLLISLCLSIKACLIRV